ncbi:hypothetical protein MY4824_004808 [Beauveria thailandica]
MKDYGNDRLFYDMGSQVSGPQLRGAALKVLSLKDLILYNKGFILRLGYSKIKYLFLNLRENY